MRRTAAAGDFGVAGGTDASPGMLRADPSLACFLEEIYAECNRPERLELDPLAVAKRYGAPADIEVAGLICSTLAFGSVELIIRACERALEPLGTSPAAALTAMSDGDIARNWAHFQYRFCFPRDMVGLLWAIRAALREYVSLEALFVDGPIGAAGGVTAIRDSAGVPGSAERTSGAANATLGGGSAASADRGAPSILPAASRFVRRLRAWSAEISPGGIRKNLLPDPANGSASKRLFLYLRWMARRDAIDPGCWRALSPARLIVPMDTHMIRTCTERLGFLSPRGKNAPELSEESATPRSTTPRGNDAGPPRSATPRPATPPAATLRDALRVTEAFRLYAPNDPVKYDFALTRPGIDPRPGDERFGCR